MRFETPRLCVREFTMEDFPALWEILGDPIAMEHMRSYEEAEAREFLRTFCVERTPPGAYAAALREGGKVIGYLLCNQIDVPGVYELGWVFHRAYWRQGYAEEAVRALTAWLFREEDAFRLVAETVDTDRCVPFLEKLGWRREGVFRQHSLGNDGRRRDLYWYGLLRRDLPVEIGPAGAADVPAVIALLRRRVDWMEERDFYQWNRTGYLDRYTEDHFLRLVREGTLFAARDAAGLAGAMALPRRDPRWPNGDDGRAFYVHHLVTDPRRPGLGRDLLTWAEGYTGDQGRTFLRLDSQEGSHALGRYYDALGYPAVGTCADGSYRGVLREKPLVPFTET